jgi:diguanylate cyclase (GGDEF)-like protein
LIWQGETWLKRNGPADVPVLLKCGFLNQENEALANYFFVFRDLSAIRDAEYKLRQLANYDSLTQLPNRNLFSDRLEHALERAAHLKSKVAVILLDLGQLKLINETYGHNLGDEILIESAERIRHCVKREDTLARLGGDEFVLLLEDIDSYDAINSTCYQLLEMIRQPYKLNQQSITLFPSIGISVYPDDERDGHKLLKYANIALLHAKSIGRCNFQYFTEKMNLLAKEQFEMESELKRAIESQELYPVFLPRFNIQSNQLAGFEVLLRWRKDSGQHVEPDEFIPIAEKLNLIIPITEWLFDQVCEFISSHQSQLADFEFSFNLSSNHFLNYDIAEAVKHHLFLHQIDCSQIELEITEDTLMKSQQGSVSKIQQLRELGVKITIDDFGTGYSSLTELKSHPIDRLKIDHSFILGIGIDNNSEAIITSIIQLASNLSLDVIAEGVENNRQLEFLKQKQCPFAQGFLLSKPLVMGQLIEFILSNRQM